jgi:AcrR family transcriptional regulator
MAVNPSRPRAPRLPPQERRELILDAALRLIDSSGYRAATMEAIAREAGVAKPVAYHLFGELGELLRALLRREEERALQQIALVVPDLLTDEDPDAALIEGIRRFLGVVEENPVTWRLILRPTEGTPAAVREHVEAGRARVAAQLQDLIAWGVKRRGGPRIDDLELAARMLILVGEQAALLLLEDQSRFDSERITRFVSGLVSQLERRDA